MKKLFFLLCFFALSIVIYGQKTDTDTDKDTFIEYLELDGATKSIGLTYKVPDKYIVTGQFELKYPPANPVELVTTAFGINSSKWKHEDGDCVIFIKCLGIKGTIDKSIDNVPKSTFSRIKNSLNMGYFNREATYEEMEELEKILTFWSPEKAKETFNAQHVITYPLNEKKAIYQKKYVHSLQ